MAADPKSSVFYNRIKGEMEAAITHLGYTSVSIARPSMLAGDRDSLKQERVSIDAVEGYLREKLEPQG